MRRTDVVEQIQAQTRAMLPGAQTILYGSEARGDAREDSDIDLLILLPEDKVSPEREHSIVSKLFEIELQSGVVISSLIMTKHHRAPFSSESAEFEALCHSRRSLRGGDYMEPQV